MENQINSGMITTTNSEYSLYFCDANKREMSCQRAIAQIIHKVRTDQCTNQEHQRLFQCSLWMSARYGMASLRGKMVIFPLNDRKDHNHV